MLDNDLIKKIRQIQIFTSHAVNAGFAGQYESVFKGRGMQFEEVREYSPGDDVRDIDWNVTAREGKPYIKKFREEREMTVVLAVDLSGSGDFGTLGNFKNELAAEFCAVLAFAAIRNNDKVGLLIFTDQIELYIPPKKGTSHVLRMIRELLSFKAQRKHTDIAQALDYVAKVTKKKAIVFLVSDFLASGFDSQLSIINRKHDLIAVHVCDRGEKEIPSAGIIEIRDCESGEVMMIDSSSKKMRRRYKEMMAERIDSLNENFRSKKVDCISLQTGKPYINDLVRFFHKRHSRR